MVVGVYEVGDDWFGQLFGIGWWRQVDGDFGLVVVGVYVQQYVVLLVVIYLGQGGVQVFQYVGVVFWVVCEVKVVVMGVM